MKTTLNCLFLILGLTTIANAQETPGETETATAEALELDCATSAESMEGEAGTVYEATCPPSCTQGTIWGTGTYTDDSAICTASIHAGVLTRAGGALTVTILAGQDVYPSAWQNGIQSQTWRQYHRTFGMAAEPVIDAPAVEDTETHRP